MLPETIEINVTQKHINKGVPEHCTACPIALATLDAISAGPDTTVTVDQDHITILRGGYRTRYDLPPQAQDFIARFDGEMDVEALTFTVYDS